MELKSGNKGQVFVIAAVLFSSLAIVLFTTTADIQADQTQNTVKNFYENAFSKAPQKLNGALRENYSINTAKKHVYSYSQFVNRSSASKSIEFGASYFIVLPQKGKSLFINYRDSSEEVEIYTGDTGWSNTTIKPQQNLEKEFSTGTASFKLRLPEQDIEQNFTASGPRIFTWMRVSAQNQIWVNSKLS